MTKIYVKLTGSDNTYLTYPCFGLLEIIEMSTIGTISQAVFRVAIKGELSTPVRVREAKFQYTPRLARNGAAMVADLVRRQAA